MQPVTTVDEQMVFLTFAVRLRLLYGKNTVFIYRFCVLPFLFGGSMISLKRVESRKWQRTYEVQRKYKDRLE